MDANKPVKEHFPTRQLMPLGVEFSEKELQEWQLLFLTSGDAVQRLEAFRRLLISQLTLEIKMKLCFQVIQEGTPQMQKEALVALQNLGEISIEDHTLMDLLLKTLDENKVQVEHAFLKLQTIELTEKTGPWVMSFFIKQFLTVEDQDRLIFLSLVMKTHARFYEPHHIAHLVSRVMSFDYGMICKLKEIFEGWATTSQQGSLLFDEHQKYALDDVGEWILPFVVTSGFHELSVIQALVKQLNGQEDLKDPSVLTNLLVLIDKGVIPVVIEDFETSRRPIYSVVVISRIVNQGKVEGELLKEVFDFCLKLLRSGKRELIPSLIEIPFGVLPIGDSCKKQWLREILAVREELSSEFLLGEIDCRIREAGALSCQVLEELVIYGSESSSRMHALRLLLLIVPEDSKELDGVGDLFEKLIESEDFDLGDVLSSYENLWAKAAYPNVRRENEVKESLGFLWRKSRTLERLEALPGAIPHLPATLATQIVLVTLELLEKRLPQIEKTTGNRRVIHLDSALREERYLVAGLRAAGQAFCRQDLLPDLQKRLAELLLENWQKIAGGSISWGPRGTRFLIRALVNLASNQKDKTREVISHLLEEMDFLEVQRSLIVMWDYLSEDDLKKVSRWITEKFQEPRQIEEDELESLLNLCRHYLENAPENVIEESIRILHRLRGMHRFAPKHITPFLSSLKLAHRELNELNGELSVLAK